jgi:hypothetical protein
MIKTKLELLVAAEQTAKKHLETKTSLESAQLVLAEFTALKVDGRHFDEFARMVADRAAVYRNLAGQDLAGETIPLPLTAAE